MKPHTSLYSPIHDPRRCHPTAKNQTSTRNLKRNLIMTAMKILKNKEWTGKRWRGRRRLTIEGRGEMADMSRMMGRGRGRNEEVMVPRVDDQVKRLVMGIEEA